MKNLLFASLAIAAVAICFQTDAQAQSGTRGAASGGNYAAPAAPMPIQSSVAPIQSQPIMMDKAMADGHAMHDQTMHGNSMHGNSMHGNSMHDHTMHSQTIAPATTHVTHAPAVHVQHACPPSKAAPRKRRGILAWLFRR